MKLTKREKDRERKAAKRTKAKERRQMKKLSANRKASLRKAQRADQLLEIDVQPRDGGERAPRWLPAAGSVVELEDSTSKRTIIGVLAAVVPAMLSWLAPQLLRTTSAVLTARGVGRRGARGASIILTACASSSGPHADGEDTLLLNVSGVRSVWYARPDHADARLTREQDGDGAPVFLPAVCDPSLPHSSSVQKGIAWRGPIELRAGDAIWIRRGWWHCVASEAKGVAIPLEIVRGSVRGSAPRVFRHVASRKPESGRSAREVSRCSNWSSASSVRKLWACALAAFDP